MARMTAVLVVLCIGAALAAKSAKLGAVGIDNVDVAERTSATLGNDALAVSNAGGFKFGSRVVPAGAAQLQAASNAATLVRGDGQTLSARKASDGRLTVGDGKAATATGARDGDLRTVKASGAQGTHDGDMRIAKDAAGDGTDIALGADGKQSLDVQAHGAQSLDSFDAANSALAARVDPATHTKTAGNGELSVQNKKKSAPEQFYLYELAQTGGDVTGELKEKEAAVGRVRKTWLCTGTKLGESKCVDNNGKQVGKVLADQQGNTVVYNDKGMPIARGQATKTADNRYIVSVNKKSNADAGLFAAEVRNFRKSDCYQEVTGKRPNKDTPIEVTDVQFVYNSESNPNGTKTIRWPDCFDVVATVKLSSAVAIDDIAVEFIATIKPLGTLQCLDQATCGRGCYYCNLCEQAATKKLTVTENSKNNVCAQKASRVYDLRTTVCPPPEDSNAALCSKFDRSIANTNYWSTNNGIDGKVLIWQRPANEATLAKRYYDVVDLPANASPIRVHAANAFNKGLELKYKAEHPNQLFTSLTNEEKYQFYIRTYGKEQLLSCKKAEVDYNLGGEKVDSNFIIEAVKVGSDGKSGKLDLFSAQPCDEWTQAQNAAYEQRKKTQSGGNVLGSLIDRLSG